MRLTKLSLAVALCAGVAAAGTAQSLRPADEVLKAAAGLPPGAAAFVLEKDSAGDPVELFGTQSSYMSVQPNMFRPRNSVSAFTSMAGSGDIALASGDPFYDYQVDLPTGTVWESVNFWGSDSDAASNLGFYAFSTCYPPGGPGNNTNTFLGKIDNYDWSAGNFFVEVPLTTPVTIDNAGCRYWIRVRFDAVGLSLTNARIRWHRQVSPAPASATFTDVPTSHPFFRYVEALAAAGITGGCGGGLYCPDNSVTRGQMAVFLSIALGLHFPN